MGMATRDRLVLTQHRALDRGSPVGRVPILDLADGEQRRTRAGKGVLALRLADVPGANEAGRDHVESLDAGEIEPVAEAHAAAVVDGSRTWDEGNLRIHAAKLRTAAAPRLDAHQVGRLSESRHSHSRYRA
jgi:hypothetical protein